MIEAVAAVPPAVLAYRHVGVTIHTCGLLLALAFPAFLVVSGTWRRLQDGLRHAAGDRPLIMAGLSGAIYASAWSVVSAGVQLAMRINRRTFGFEDQTWAAWLVERAGGTAALAVAGLVVTPVIAAVAFRNPR